MKPKSTILDIAKKAGVSHGTVSRVLNDKPIRCREETRAKILEIAQQLNYQPDLSAKALKTRKHFAIGFVAYDITDAFVVDCIGAIEARLAQTEYRALWLSAAVHSSEKEGDFLEKIPRLPIDALIVLESESLISDAQLLTLHGRDQMPLSTLIRKIEGGHISSVTVDSPLGVELSIQHLLSLGHRKLGFCYGPKIHPGAVIRFQHFQKLLSEKGLPIQADWYSGTDGTVESGYKAAKQILRSKNRPTAIIAHNDLAAFGCIRACFELGLRVPDQISIIGFDDIRMAAQYNPSLTTIAVNFKALAEATISQMVSLLDSPPKLFHAEHRCIEPRLVERESTAPPK